MHLAVILDEIVSNILEYLSINDLRHVSIACHTWYRISARFLWRKPPSHAFKMVSETSRLIYQRAVHTLCTPENYGEIALWQFPVVHQLHIQYSYLERPFVLHLLSNQCGDKLQSVVIDNPAKTLNAGGNGYGKINGARKLDENAPLHSEILLTLARLPHLDTLDIAAVKLCDSSFQQVLGINETTLSSSPTFRRLQRMIVFMESASLRLFTFVFSQSSLSHLTLGVYGYVNIANLLVTLNTALTGLVSLHISFTDCFLPLRTGSNIPSFPQLRHLSLHSSRLVSPEHFEDSQWATFLMSFPRLHSLSVLLNCRFSAYSYLVAARKCPKLRSLKLSAPLCLSCAPRSRAPPILSTVFPHLEELQLRCLAFLWECYVKSGKIVFAQCHGPRLRSDRPDYVAESLTCLRALAPKLTQLNFEVAQSLDAAYERELMAEFSRINGGT